MRFRDGATERSIFGVSALGWQSVLGDVYLCFISYVCLGLFEKNMKRTFLCTGKGHRDINGTNDNITLWQKEYKDEFFKIMRSICHYQSSSYGIPILYQCYESKASGTWVCIYVCMSTHQCTPLNSNFI